MRWDFVTIATLVIFCLTYLGVAMGHYWGLRLDRAGITLLGGIAMLAFGCIDLDGAIKSVNYQSILMLFGLMVIAGQLRYGGFYQKIAEKISLTLDHPARFLLILMVASGFFSAFLNNDVICFAFTPVVANALVKKRMNPAPFLIALAISSNIGCAGTMIGNAQNVLLGELAHLGFGAYIAWTIVPVIVSMTVAYFIILWIGRNSFNEEPRIELSDESKPVEEEKMPFRTWRTVKGLITIIVIVIFFFIPGFPRYLVTLVGAGVLLCSHKLDSKKVLALVDWQLLILFIGLFVVVGAFEKSGLASSGVAWISHHGVNLKNPYVLALSTGFLSNLINNSAAVMLLVKVVNVNTQSGYILALANTFAGNLLLIGSVANIIVAQSAAAHGVKISFVSFAKYGIPCALASFLILMAWISIMV